MNEAIITAILDKSAESDVSKVNCIMKIWLETNIDAHNFIPKEYWVSNYEAVKNALYSAQILMYEQDIIKGFIGITDSFYIAGLFVAKDFQRCGIGSLLIEECKRRYSCLELDVYVNNTGSVAFYKHHGFAIEHEKENDDTKEKEYHMSWNTKNYCTL